MSNKEIKFEEKRVKAGVEIRPDLRRRLKQLGLQLDRPMWSLTEQALEAYLDGVKDQPPEDRDIPRARFILEHGDESAFRTIVEAFYAQAKANPRKADGKGRKKAV